MIIYITILSPLRNEIPTSIYYHLILATLLLEKIAKLRVQENNQVNGQLFK